MSRSPAPRHPGRDGRALRREEFRPERTEESRPSRHPGPGLPGLPGRRRPGWTDPAMEELYPARAGRRERARRGTAQWGRYRLAADSVEALRVAGMFGTVERSDLSELFESAGRARRALPELESAGLLRTERYVRGSRVVNAVTLTGTGKRLLERGVDPRPAGDIRAQAYRAGTARPSQVLHDTAVYRAARREWERIEAMGGRVQRVRSDGDLRRIANRIASAERKAGAGEERSRSAAADALGLRVAGGKLSLPDVRLEYSLPDPGDGIETAGYVDVEVVTRDYRSRALAAKAEAGFRVHEMDADGTLLPDSAGGEGRVPE